MYMIYLFFEIRPPFEAAYGCALAALAVVTQRAQPRLRPMRATTVEAMSNDLETS